MNSYEFDINNLTIDDLLSLQEEIVSNLDLAGIDAVVAAISNSSVLIESISKLSNEDMADIKCWIGNHELFCKVKSEFEYEPPEQITRQFSNFTLIENY